MTNKSFTLTCLLLLSVLFVQAQNGTITSTVKDTLGEPLPGTTVVLMNTSDSVMVSFNSADENGLLLLKKVPKGSYVYRLSLMGFDIVDKAVTVSDKNQNVDLGVITMRPKEYTLSQVTVSGERIPLVIKEDTIIYNADAFKPKEEDVVEDLLKKMPGIEVDRDGNIKAQGEDVEKVTVDGKEFFGSDPKLATKNLPAKAVDKVKVFDAKSEKAEFSGVDDGERTKTLDLELKKDAKKGYFGKLEAGYGTENTAKGKLSFNRFTKKLQLSIIGMGNNVNEQGFSITDYLEMMGGMAGMMGGGGSRINPDAAGINIGQNNQSGIFTTGAGGTNLNYDFGKKTDLNLSYFATHYSRDLERESEREYVNDVGQFDSDEVERLSSTSFNHRINFKLKHKATKKNELTGTGRITLNDAESSSGESILNVKPDNSPASQTTTTQTSNGYGPQLRLGLTSRNRLKKRGRTFVGRVRYENENRTRDFDLISRSLFFENSSQYLDTLDQIQSISDRGSSFETEFTFTDRVAKRKYIEINYEHESEYDHFDKDFSDAAGDGTYLINENLSSTLYHRFHNEKIGTSYKWSNKKTTVNVGGAMHFGRQLIDASSIEGTETHNYTSFHPSISIRHELGRAKSWNLRYSTRLNAPSASELYPAVDNSNPLQRTIGNPDLDPEYRHSMNLRFRSFSQFTFSGVFAFLNASYTKNKIANAINIDQFFRQTSQPVNTDGSYAISGFTSLSRPINKLKIRGSINLRSSFNTGESYYNGVSNDQNRWNNSIGFSASNTKNEIIDVLVGGNISNNVTTYSLENRDDQRYTNYNFYTEFRADIAKTWVFETEADYFSYNSSNLSDVDDVINWNASISRYLTKNKFFLVKLSVADILDQNRGFAQNISENYIEQERTNTLGRYFMLGASWSLSGFGKKALPFKVSRRMMGGRRR